MKPASEIYSTHFIICRSPQILPSAPLTLMIIRIMNALMIGASISSTSTTSISTPRLFLTAIADASVTLDTDSTMSPIPGIAPAVFWITALFVLSTTGVMITCRILLPDITTTIIFSTHCIPFLISSIRALNRSSPQILSTTPSIT